MRGKYLEEYNKQKCKLCGNDSKNSVNFVPNCRARFGVYQASMNGLCMFKPEFQHQCRFFEPK